MVDATTWHILDATADDWESLDQIEKHVQCWCGPIGREAIAAVICNLLGLGLFDEMQGRDVVSADVLDRPIEFWFRMTERGREFWESAALNYRADG